MTMNLTMKMRRGQCYDECSTMKVERNGVITIKSEESRAPNLI